MALNTTIATTPGHGGEGTQISVMDVLRQVLLANGCVALFLCVDEAYQLHVTMVLTIGVLTYMGREHAVAAMERKED